MRFDLPLIDHGAAVRGRARPLICRAVMNDDPLPAAAGGAVAALGNFDGLHLGHQALVGRAVALAGSLGRPAAIVTFSPHPRSVLRGDRHFALANATTTLEVAGQIGVDYLFEQRFDRDFARLDPLRFVFGILYEKLHIHSVVVGSDFRFGAGRSGNAAFLAEAATDVGISVTVMPKIGDPSGVIYSSTGVRAAIAAGDFSKVLAMLGRQWSITGTAVALPGESGGMRRVAVPLGELQRPPAGFYRVAVRALSNAAVTALTIAQMVPGSTAEGDSIVLADPDGRFDGKELAVAFIARAEASVSHIHVSKD